MPGKISNVLLSLNNVITVINNHEEMCEQVTVFKKVQVYKWETKIEVLFRKKIAIIKCKTNL